jgi:hypothetical protein
LGNIAMDDEKNDSASDAEELQALQVGSLL